MQKYHLHNRPNRELKEETGYSGKLELLCAGNPWVGISPMHTSCFLATDLVVGERCQDANEDIEVVRMPYDDLLAKVLNGSERNIQQVAWPVMALELKRRR